MFSGCDNKLQHYQDGEPRVDIKSYFNGRIKAWGIVQDWRGRVVTRFDVTMHGTWKGDEGILQEHFEYYDGRTQERTWHLSKLADGRYLGKADDIIGNASGLSKGYAIRWQYYMNVPVSGKFYCLFFEDWMWHLHDGILVNRSYLKKFGITVAELTLFMQKQKDD
jgi:hypothetical protein